ncbi:MAG: transposase family protein [Bacteroidales bacterium]|nr:transposase family protein [Bacteroidales bacterium]
MNILYFANNIPDFCQELKIRHQTGYIVFITVAAVICRTQDWEDIEYFGHCKLVQLSPRAWTHLHTVLS